MKLCHIAIAAGLLSACTEVELPNAPPVAVQKQESSVLRSQAQGTAILKRVSRRVEPVAERICREERRPTRAIECNFRIVVDTGPAKAPNAYQTLDRKTGQPVIAFNVPMLRTARNDDEIAFIMGHEAGHQIGAHIAKSQTSAGLASVILGGLIAASGGSAAAIDSAQKFGGAVGSRIYSKNYELEADVIGAYVADAAGYDPARGAQSFARFSGGSNALLSTHPPSASRIATVMATVEDIKRQRALGQTPKLKRR